MLITLAPSLIPSTSMKTSRAVSIRDFLMSAFNIPSRSQQVAPLTNLHFSGHLATNLVHSCCKYVKHSFPKFMTSRPLAFMHAVNVANLTSMLCNGCTLSVLEKSTAIRFDAFLTPDMMSNLTKRTITLRSK